MKVGVLYSGGKDSTLAALIAHEGGYDIGCLITVVSRNKESFMFHTPSISRAELQAEAMGIPLVVKETDGQKEDELIDLGSAIVEAMEKFKIEGVVSGAVESVYQASRIERICNSLGIECFNPLWQKDQVELLLELINRKFDVVVVGVFAQGLGEEFLGRRIDRNFIEEMKRLRRKWGISPSGEGGEYETFVLNCSLFKKALRVKSYEDFGGDNSWRRELELF